MSWKVNVRHGPGNNPQFYDVYLATAYFDGNSIVLDKRQNSTIPVTPELVSSVSPICSLTEESTSESTVDAVCEEAPRKSLKDAIFEEKVLSETPEDVVYEEKVSTKATVWSVFQEKIPGGAVSEEKVPNETTGPVCEESPSVTPEDLVCETEPNESREDAMGKLLLPAQNKKVPSITYYVLLGDGRMIKLSHLIFTSGEKLLLEKIENSAKGISEEKYSIGQHVEKMSYMYPELRKYNPDKISQRVSKYIAIARSKVLHKISQGEINEDGSYFQDCHKEATLIKLLDDSEKVCRPPLQHKKIYYGAQSRYEGNLSSVRMDLLEEEESCFLCHSSQDLVGTDLGKTCRSCLRCDESTENKTVKKFRDEGLQRKEQATIQQHNALMEMDETVHVKKKIKRSRGRMRNFSSDDNDDEIGEALISQLKYSKVRDDLEIEKLKLELLIKKKKLNMKCEDEDEDYDN